MFGDVLSETGFGGSPRQFFLACQKAGFAQHAWRVNLERLRWPRRIWNLGQVMRGRKPGGFQYTRWCARTLLKQVPRDLWETEIITFHQNFPPIEPVLRAGGEINFYFDATYKQLFPAYGLDKKASAGVLSEAIEREQIALGLARRVITNQSWALRSVRQDYGVPEEKTAMILGGANVDLPEGYSNAASPGRPGKDRPFMLGFIGKDWHRKGLDFLMKVRDELVRRGWQTQVRAMGFDGRETPFGAGIECLGFIDKKKHFLPFVQGLDIGCLFSRAEAAGTAIFEFLRCEVPVAGFTVDGLHDLLPLDAGFRFVPERKFSEVADVFEAYLQDEALQDRMRACARAWSPLVTWERCVAEMQELWDTGTIRRPVRPWLGLDPPLPPRTPSEG